MSFCQYCGAQLPEKAKFCTSCGSAASNSPEPVSVQQPIQQPAQPINVQQPVQQPAGAQQYQSAPQAVEYDEFGPKGAPAGHGAAYQPQVQPAPQPHVSGARKSKGSIGWGVLGFIIPLVGIILFFVWRKTRPGDAKNAIIGAAASVILAIVLSLVGGAAGSMTGGSDSAASDSSAQSVQPADPGNSDSSGQSDGASDDLTGTPLTGSDIDSNVNVSELGVLVDSDTSVSRFLEVESKVDNFNAWVDIESEALDADGNVVATATGIAGPLSKGECALVWESYYLEDGHTASEIASYRTKATCSESGLVSVTFDLSEEDYYEDDKVIASFTNEGNKEIESMCAYCLTLQDGEIRGVSFDYADEIAPGKTVELTFEPYNTDWNQYTIYWNAYSLD